MTRPEARHDDTALLPGRLRRWASAFAVAAAVLHAPDARAQDTGDIEALLEENVITTASTTAEKATTAPATSVTITGEQLRMYGLRTLAEAVNFLSLGVVSTDRLGTPDIGGRGVLLPYDEGKHFLLLVNGHAMNDALFGSARFDQGAGFPIDAVDRIEVIVGAGSVLYGSNAMVGVINVITKTAPEYRGVHVLGEYEWNRSVRAGLGAGVTFDLFGEDAEITTAGEYYERFGPDLFFERHPVQVNPATGSLLAVRRNEVTDGIWGGTVRDAYFTKAVSGLVRFRVGDFEANILGNMYERGLPYSNARYDVFFDDKESFELDRSVRVDLKYSATLSPLVSLTSRVYVDAFDFQRERSYAAENGCFRTDFDECLFRTVGVAQWAGIEERLSLNWLEDLSLVTMFGIDARMRWVRSKEESQNFETRELVQPAAGLIDRSAAIVSPYIQQTWSPARWIDMNVGARFDADERFDPVLSPRAAVALSPVENTTFKAVYSQAFRSPTFFETDFTGFIQASSDDLDPETVRSVEGSIQQRFGKHRILVGAFYNWWNELIEERLLNTAERTALQDAGQLPLLVGDVTQSRNLSDIKNFGWNASIEGTLGESRFKYGFNITHAFTTLETPARDLDLPGAPQLFGNVRLAYEHGGYIPTPAVAVHFVDERPVDRIFGPDFIALDARTAPASAEIRGTVTGKVPVPKGLGYRVSASYTTTDVGQYIAGNERGINRTPLNRIPIDDFKVFFGLRYDFGDSDAEEEAP